MFFLVDGGQNHEMYEVGSLYMKAEVSNVRFRHKIGGIIHFSAQSTVSEKLYDMDQYPYVLNQLYNMDQYIRTRSESNTD